VTTKSDHADPIAPNTLGREFDINAIGRVNRVCAADITYIPTRAGWLYLAIVTDLASRRVIGWATSSLLERSLATSALAMVFKQRMIGKELCNVPAQGSLLHHSDRVKPMSSQ